MYMSTCMWAILTWTLQKLLAEWPSVLLLISWSWYLFWFHDWPRFHLTSILDYSCLLCCLCYQPQRGLLNTLLSSEFILHCLLIFNICLSLTPGHNLVSSHSASTRSGSGPNLPFNWTWHILSVIPAVLLPTWCQCSQAPVHSAGTLALVLLQTLSQLSGVFRQELCKRLPLSPQATHTGTWQNPRHFLSPLLR